MISQIIFFLLYASNTTCVIDCHDISSYKSDNIDEKLRCDEEFIEVVCWMVFEDTKR